MIASLLYLQCYILDPDELITITHNLLNYRTLYILPLTHARLVIYSQHAGPVKACWKIVEEQPSNQPKNLEIKAEGSLTPRHEKCCLGLASLLPYKILMLHLNSAAFAVTKIPKFHHITPILKNSLHWLKINKIIKYRFFLSYINLSKLFNLLTSALFLYSLHIVVLNLLLISPLVALLLS